MFVAFFDDLIKHIILKWSRKQEPCHFRKVHVVFGSKLFWEPRNPFVTFGTILKTRTIEIYKALDTDHLWRMNEKRKAQEFHSVEFSKPLEVPLLPVQLRAKKKKILMKPNHMKHWEGAKRFWITKQCISRKIFFLFSWQSKNIWEKKKKQRKIDVNTYNLVQK